MFNQFESEQHRDKVQLVLAGLGEFVVSFERVCSEMRCCIREIFQREGLINQGLAQVVSNNLAIEGLRTMLGSLFQELGDQDKADQNAVKKLLGQINKPGTTRNQLLHAEWHLNYDYEGKEDKFFALALKPRASQSDGADWIRTSVSREILDKHIQEATKILVFLRRLTICLRQKGFKASEQFSRPL